MLYLLGLYFQQGSAFAVQTGGHGYYYYATTLRWIGHVIRKENESTQRQHYTGFPKADASVVGIRILGDVQ